MPNGDGALDRLVVALPEPFPDRFARCDEFEPPVELLWFLPFAASEQHIVTDHGWRELLALDSRARRKPIRPRSHNRPLA
jgi:hypothetical protein